MAYDRNLADRLRTMLAGKLPDGRRVREAAMFGGLGFLVNEKLAVCADSRGGLLVRCDPASSNRLLSAPGVKRPTMGAGRQMGKGWIHVAIELTENDYDLGYWTDLALEYNAGITPPHPFG